MDLTLDQLLASFETGMQKSASEGEDKKEEAKDEKNEFPFKKKDEEVSEKSEEKKDEDESKDESEGQEKEASLAGAALAREVMQKVASLNLDNGMNKQASTAGQALARALLKKASAGDVSTTNGITSEAVPNKSQVDNAEMEAEGAAAIKALPTGDGVRNYGTVNEIFDAMIQDALAQGAASTDQVHERGVAKNEGAVLEHAVPNQIKVAAMNALMQGGFDFDTAAQLLKSAERNDHKIEGYISPAWQENAIAKDHGKEGLKGVGANVSKHITGGLRVAGRGYLEGFGGSVAGGLIGQAVGLAGKNAHAVRTGTSVGATLGGLGGLAHGVYSSLKNQADEAHKKYASEQDQSQDEIEKAAAISHLVANGVNFDDAFEMVKQAEAEIAFEMEKAACLETLINEGVDYDSAVELVKQAAAGDLNTTDGVNPGSVPNKNQEDNAQMEAEGAATVKPLPTGNGIAAQGNVNQIFDAIVDDALAQGAASSDQVHERGVSKAEGAVEAHAVPNQVKVAAMNKLLEAGVDFEKAAEIVKQAGAAAIPSFLTKVRGNAINAVKDAKALVGAGPSRFPMAPDSKGMIRPLKRDSAMGLVKNPVVQAGAATAAAGAGAAALSREKKAAVDMLTEAGIDFDSAVSLVNEKAAELYGE